MPKAKTQARRGPATRRSQSPGRDLHLALKMPCYERAFAFLLNRLIYSFAEAQNPLLKKIGFSQEVPALHPQQISGAKGETILEPFAMSQAFQFSREQMLNGDRIAFLEQSFDAGAQFGQSLMKKFFASMDKVTAATGMEVDGKQFPNRIERILAVLDKVELAFDQEGKFTKPDLIMGPKESEGLAEEIKKAGPAFQERVEAIIKKKREAWLATRSTRCLPQLFQD